jgi:hypothetical protein
MLQICYKIARILLKNCQNFVNKTVRNLTKTFRILTQKNTFFSKN